MLIILYFKKMNSETIENEIKEHLAKHKNILDKSCLNDWKNTEINVAVLGEDDETSQKFLVENLIGFYEKQVEKANNAKASLENPQCFVHSNNTKFHIWDLGSVNIEDYYIVDMQNIMKDSNSLYEILSSKNFENQLNKYDFFVLLTKSPNGLTNNEQMFGNKVISLNKKIYFVNTNRNKVINENKIHPCNDIYVISQDFNQFIKLNQDILDDLIKNEKLATSYILTIEPSSHEIILKKTEVLKNRAYQIAIISSIFGYFLPLPSLKIAADISLIVSEIVFYLKQFSLNKQSIEKFASSIRNVRIDLSKILASSKYASLLLIDDFHSLHDIIVKTLPLFAVNTVVDLVKFVPIMGFFLKGVVSYETTKSTLIDILDEFSKIAIEVQTFLKQQTDLEQKV